MPKSAWIFPALAVLFFAAATATGLTFTPSTGGIVFAVVLLVILFGTVFAAVHHAEVIAQRIGEPYGTLLLTLAVTIIEVALIATIMLGDKAVPTLARDTVFAVVMIVCNGLVGICIMAGGWRYREQSFQMTGSNLYLSVLVVLATMTLIMPNYTLTTPGPVYSLGQLAFVSVVDVDSLRRVSLHADRAASRLFHRRVRRGWRPSRPRLESRHRDQRSFAAGVAARGGAAREEILAGGGRWRRGNRRTAGVRGHSGGAADPVA